MKLTRLFTPIFAALMLCSCSTPEPLFKFENYNYDNNNKKRPFTVDYYYITIANASRSKALQAIEESLRYEFFQLEGQLPSSLKRTFDLGAAQFRSESGYDELDIDIGYTLYVDSEVKVIDRTLTYTIQGYKYTGGFHGLGWRTGLNYDIDSGKQLALHDVLSDAQLEALPDIMRKQLCADKGIFEGDTFENLTNLGYYPNEILPTENFRLTIHGIEFIFNPYEIGAYHLGITTILIPYTKLDEIATNN